jgi:hypothetical protein
MLNVPVNPLLEVPVPMSEPVIPEYPEPETILATVEEARRLLFGKRLGRNAFYDAIKRGEVPSIRIGHRIFVPMVAAKQKLGGAL